jgi:hypothetical protein
MRLDSSSTHPETKPNTSFSGTPPGSFKISVLAAMGVSPSTIATARFEMLGSLL